MPTTEYHYVYLLVNENDPARHYTGCTADLPGRLQKHNEGGVPHTAKFKPWRVGQAIHLNAIER